MVTHHSSSQDFIEAAGLPFLAHRLRRMAETILEASATFLPESGLPVPPRAVSTLLLLKHEGALSVTEIAFRLRLSHPLIISLTRTLKRQGIVTDRTDPKDRRRRLIKLTAAGVQVTEGLESNTTILARTFSALAEETGHDLFHALEAHEEALARVDLLQRLRREAADQPGQRKEHLA